MKKKNILSIAASVSLIFNVTTASAAERFGSSLKPAVLEGIYDIKIDDEHNISNIIPIEKIMYSKCQTTEIPEEVSDETSADEVCETSVSAPQTQNTQTAKAAAESPKTETKQSAPAQAVTNTAPQTSYSENDLYWLSRLIEAEASGESAEGKSAVGGCVMNRVKSSEFPNTVYGVIFDTKHGVQYQPTANGAIYNTPSAESVKAAKDALSGKSTAGNAMYFCNTRVAKTSWAASNRPYLMTIGNHVFYL